MTPKLVGFGKSFKGLGLYVLHDPDRAQSADRVAWTETRNLGTQDGDLAWRVMAATAMNQAALKRQAGIPNTGRKSKQYVAHLILSWHADEAPELTRDEMMRAANGALKAIGADQHQVLVAAHTDKQPHLHLVINRVSPTDGRMLNPSHPKLKLSAWAEAYERERGKIYCPARVANNAARRRGEFTRDKKHVPRHIYELEAGNDNRKGFEAERKKQRALDAALARRRRERQSRRQTQWADLHARRQQSITHIKDDNRRQIQQMEAATRERYRPQWLALHHAQREALDQFDRREGNLLGRLQNALQGLTVRGARPRDVLSEAYSSIASAGQRRARLLQQQEAEQQQLERTQRREETTQRRALLRTQRDRLVDRRVLFMAERATLILTHDMEDAADRLAWKKRRDERQRAYEALPEPSQRPEKRLNKYQELSRQRQQRRQRDRDRGRGGRERD